MQKLETAYFSPEVGSIGLEREPRGVGMVGGSVEKNNEEAPIRADCYQTKQRLVRYTASPLRIRGP